MTLEMTLVRAVLPEVLGNVLPDVLQAAVSDGDPEGNEPLRVGQGEQHEARARRLHPAGNLKRHGAAWLTGSQVLDRDLRSRRDEATVQNDVSVIVSELKVQRAPVGHSQDEFCATAPEVE